MAKIYFVSTLIPADKFKKKYELGGITICHIGETLDEKSGAYKCWECTVPTATFSEDLVKTELEAFGKEMQAFALQTAKQLKIAEIDAYDKSSAVNGFALNGAVVWLDKATRVGLMNSTSIAKGMGQATTTLWFGGMKIVVNCDKAIGLLSALEMYALECFNVTAAHKKAVAELNTVEEVLGYDYTKGYPEQLKMEVSL